jgi:hypothetical protein
MQLKYVGAMPLVSNKGVGFDKTKPDKYTFLNAAIELLEALNYGATEKTKHLHNVAGKEYTEGELMSLLQKYCSNLEEKVLESDKKAKDFVEDLIKRVHENTLVSEDGRTAWLNNIELMKDYFYQYIMNEAAYKCALDALGQEIHDARVEEVTFPMFRNYGLVLHDLEYVLEHRKSPIDGVLTIETGQKGAFGKLTIKHR